MAFSPRALNRFTGLVFQCRNYSAPAERAIPPSKQKYVPTSGTYPKGFLVGTSHAGVKESNTQYDDIALVVSETPCPAAGCFTRNKFKAAPVLVSKRNFKNYINHKYRGVVVNSGCANAVTGAVGLANATTMSETVADCYNDDPSTTRTLVMSTGVIGKQLPIEKISQAIPKAHASLGASHDHWLQAARAICTTDTFPKLISRTFSLPSHPKTTYSIAGMTKGAGMIHPNMGTLLGIVCTDAKISQEGIKRVLSYTSDKAFNRISIDGDTSTNDSVMFFANGAAAPEETKSLRFNGTSGEPAIQESEDAIAFRSMMEGFMQDLAQLVVRDGEGATKFITLRVLSHTPRVAMLVARSVANSPLVKTAMYGKDANWGRILCAVGYTNSHVGVVPSRTTVSFLPTDGSPPLKLLVRGEPLEIDETRAKEVLELEDLEILIDLDDEEGLEKPSGKEKHEVKFWTCDLSHEYVTINGDYRT